jgi:GNAT superfamily N-acetyltransferase
VGVAHPAPENGLLNGSVDIQRIDPLSLGLDTADEMAAVERVSYAAAGLDLPSPVGPAKLLALQRSWDNRPVDGLWVAREGGEVIGHAVAQLPVRDNTDAAHLRVTVLPAVRRRGIGRALMAEAVGFAHAAGRTRVYAGTFRGSDGGPALRALGFSSEGLGVNAVRRVDVHGTPPDSWQRLYDDASGHASDYELIHLVGSTPDDMLEDMVTLHAAINDAPLDDPESEEDAWEAGRVRDFDTAMAARRQTVYRVMARHRATGTWAGLSMLLVDEFLPTTAFQEDTSVVRAHRGHRLGLLMKADMLRRISRERPEIAATDTWNATTNHHMIAVNERLGASVVAHHETYRLREG